MKKILITITMLALLTGVGVYYTFLSLEAVKTPSAVASTESPAPAKVKVATAAVAQSSIDTGSTFVAPIDNALSRITKKDFGIKISPEHSPVEHERFSGYHTAVDFEMLDESENSREIEVRAVCAGPLRIKEWAKGYGGVAVQECTLDGKPISIVYGHMDVESILVNVGEDMKPGQRLGNLGDAFSKETDGGRKHLHLGFYNGVPADIRGYIPNEEDLVKWINPCLYICKEYVGPPGKK